MKNSTYKNLLGIAKSRGLLAVFGGLILVSCGSQMGGYTETDGVYYDPNKDVIPEGITMPEPNQVDEVYTYENDSMSIIEQNQQNQLAQQNKYKNWNNNQQPQSDWGNYTGTEQNYYYDNWGYPYGFGGGFGMNSYFGFGWNNWNFGGSWNSFGYNPYYWDYYWGGYYPSYGYYGYYNPWYYNNYYPYYGGYYGYNSYYGPRYNYKRSGADSIIRGNGFNGNHRNITRPNQGLQGNSGFRSNPRTNNSPNINQTPRNPNNSGFRSTPRSNNNTPRQTTPRTTTPRQTPTRQYDAPRQSTPSSNWGNSNSNSGGGFRSGGGSSSSGSSNSGGGVRSGGFR